MRLKITNRSTLDDIRLLPLIQFAATHFNVAGKVHVTFSACRRQMWGGWCKYWSRQISVRSTLRENHPYFPVKKDTLGYFPGSKIPIKPYEIRSVDEIIVHVAAHEFGHLMRSGQKFRKSRIEVFCENRATEVLEAFRSEAGQKWIADRRCEMLADEPVQPSELTDDDRRAAKLARIADARTKALAAQKRWESKRKRADTALRKLKARLRGLDRREAAL